MAPLQGDAGADVEWILKAGGVVSRGTPNFFAQNERSASSAERCGIFFCSPVVPPPPTITVVQCWMQFPNP